MGRAVEQSLTDLPLGVNASICHVPLHTRFSFCSGARGGDNSFSSPYCVREGESEGCDFIKYAKFNKNLSNLSRYKNKEYTGSSEKCGIFTWALLLAALMVMRCNKKHLQILAVFNF